MTDAEKRALLVSLRERIPEMMCIPGCTQCCGHIAISKFEWNLFPEDAKRDFNMFSFDCHFCGRSGCSIHEDRPILCRMFGVCEGMECPRGVKPPRLLRVDHATEIVRTYINNFFEGEPK